MGASSRTGERVTILARLCPFCDQPYACHSLDDLAEEVEAAFSDEPWWEPPREVQDVAGPTLAAVLG